MYEPLANRITAEFNVLLTHTFVPVAETSIGYPVDRFNASLRPSYISILFLTKRGGKDSNLRAPKGATSLAGKRIQPDSATTANSSVV